MTDINLSRLHRWGEGIFTTLLIQSGHPVNLDAHLVRLKQAGQLIGLTPALDREFFLQQISRLSHGTNCVIRLEFSVPDDLTDPPQVSLSARPLPKEWSQLPETGVSLVESAISYSPPFPDVGWIKWNAWQPWAILRRQLQSEWDVIVTDGSEWLETTRAGLVAVRNDEWFTNQSGGRCLKSTAIAAVKIWRETLGLTVQETVFTREFCNEVSQWFVANAVIGLVPVVSITLRDGLVRSFPPANGPAHEFRTWYLNR
ncbi:MAG: aminotransferase class IV [Bacteroidetes bacterium]|nr:aminotransferase class IV [Bacteroidota bacterium]